MYSLVKEVLFSEGPSQSHYNLCHGQLPYVCEIAIFTRCNIHTYNINEEVGMNGPLVENWL